MWLIQSLSRPPVVAERVIRSSLIAELVLRFARAHWLTALSQPVLATSPESITCATHLLRHWKSHVLTRVVRFDFGAFGTGVRCPKNSIALLAYLSELGLHLELASCLMLHLQFILSDAHLMHLVYEIYILCVNKHISIKYFLNNLKRTWKEIDLKESSDKLKGALCWSG